MLSRSTEAPRGLAIGGFPVLGRDVPKDIGEIMRGKVVSWWMVAALVGGCALESGRAQFMGAEPPPLPNGPVAEQAGSVPLPPLLPEVNPRGRESWVPVGLPPWTNAMFRTIKDLTYFTHDSWPVPNCEGVISEPVTQSGTNILQAISLAQWTGPCVACADCPHFETHISVLGALAPGDYMFLVSSPGPNPTDPPGLGMRIPFTVPASQDRTLISSIDTNGPTLNVSVAGISNVTYVVESSSTLTNWTPVVTNTGAPFTWRLPLSACNPNGFYRVSVSGN